MAYDAVKLKDWQISEEAEKNMPGPDEWREKLGLEKDEMLPMGRLGCVPGCGYFRKQGPGGRRDGNPGCDRQSACESGFVCG